MHWACEVRCQPDICWTFHGRVPPPFPVRFSLPGPVLEPTIFFPSPRLLRTLVCVTGVLGPKINPTTFTGVPTTPQSNRSPLPDLHQNREGCSSSTAGCPGCPALQTLTNRWEGEADVLSKENGRLWGSGKNKALRRTHSMGSTSQGPPPAEGCLSAATNSFSTGTSSLLAAFTSLSLTPLQRDGL